MTISDLRWLVRCGYLAHAREISGSDDTERRFDAHSQNLVLFPNTCFVLTASGLALLGREVSTNECLAEISAVATECLGVSREDQLSYNDVASTAAFPGSAVSEHTRQASAASICLHVGSLSVAAPQPNWDADSRTFKVGDHLVKQFRVPSRNQEAVLNAFQEEGWPRFVDDPLPPMPDQQPKRRLRDTIKCLNLNQVTRAIRFRGDGTGQRVSWELLIGVSAPDAGAQLPHRRAA